MLETAVQHATWAQGSPLFTERLACELCQCRGSDVLYAEPLTGGRTFSFIDHYYGGRVPEAVLSEGTYVVRRCRSCGFIWQGEVLNDYYLDLLYSQWIDISESARKHADKSFTALARLVHEISALPYLAKRPASELRALDFGAGWGRWCQIANAIGIMTWAAEVSDVRVAHMRSLGIPICDDIFSDQYTYHFINAEQVFEHLPDPRRYFDRLASLLVPGGIIRISVPDGNLFEREFEAETWQPHKDAVQPLEHINCYTKDSVRSLARDVNVRIVPSSKVCNAYARCLIRGNGSLKTLKSALTSLTTGVTFFQRTVPS